MIKSEKRILRRELGRIGRSIDGSIVVKESQIVCSLLESLNEYNNAKSIAFYLPMVGELSLIAAMENAFQNKKCYSPRVLDGENIAMLTVFDFKEISGFTKSKWGIPEPPQEPSRELQEDLDVILVPCCAFDRYGNRLGHGKGYYDRFINAQSKRPLLIGVCLQYQLIEHVPTDSHDYPMDMIVTPEGVLRMKSN